MVSLLLAATGRLTPVFAALAMVLSSLVVVRLSMSAGRLKGDSTAGRSPRDADLEAVAKVEGLDLERQHV